MSDPPTEQRAFEGQPQDLVQGFRTGINGRILVLEGIVESRDLFGERPPNGLDPGFQASSSEQEERHTLGDWMRDQKGFFGLQPLAKLFAGRQWAQGKELCYRMPFPFACEALFEAAPRLLHVCDVLRHAVRAVVDDQQPKGPTRHLQEGRAVMVGVIPVGTPHVIGRYLVHEVAAKASWN